MSQIPEPEQAYGTEPAPSGWSGQGGGRSAEPHRPPAGQGSPGTPVSTIVLLVISGLITLTGVGFLWAAPAVLAIVALVRTSADPAGSRRLTRIGWWIAGALAVLTVLVAVLVAVLLVTRTPSYPPDAGYGSSTVGLSAAPAAAVGR